MNLAEKLQTSRALMKSSLRVVRDHPRLALFPVVSAGCTLLLAAFFLVPVAVLVVQSPVGQSWLAGQGWAGARAKEAWEGMRWVFYSYGVVIYFVSMFVATFFNVAFYNEILRAPRGRKSRSGTACDSRGGSCGRSCCGACWRARWVRSSVRSRSGWAGWGGSSWLSSAWRGAWRRCLPSR